jgi:hypothetical protein
MPRVVWKAAFIGVAHSVVQCAVLFMTSERYTLAKDWFLAVMILFANTTGFAITARYGINLLGVAICGFLGMMVGGWFGIHSIGSYEYKVPAPPEDRVMRFSFKDRENKTVEKEVELKHVPHETVKRIPVGGGLGVLAGWALGVGLYVWLLGKRNQEANGSEELDQVDVGNPDSKEQ